MGCGIWYPQPCVLPVLHRAVQHFPLWRYGTFRLFTRVEDGQALHSTVFFLEESGLWHVALGCSTWFVVRADALQS